jgi:hypothetical protein
LQTLALMNRRSGFMSPFLPRRVTKAKACSAEEPHYEQAHKSKRLRVIDLIQLVPHRKGGVILADSDPLLFSGCRSALHRKIASRNARAWWDLKLHPPVP